MYAEIIPIQKYKNRLPWRTKGLRFIWNGVWFFLFRPTPSWCLHGWRRFLLRLFGAQIGKGCVIYPSCRIWAPWNLELGELVCLAEGVDCYCVAPIQIGPKVTVSQRSFLCAASHNIAVADFPLTHSPIRIERFAWIAAQAYVGPGLTVGEGAVVGACAVVTKDVGSWTVVAGNPARLVKKRVVAARAAAAPRL